MLEKAKKFYKDHEDGVKAVLLIGAVALGCVYTREVIRVAKIRGVNELLLNGAVVWTDGFPVAGAPEAAEFASTAVRAAVEMRPKYWEGFSAPEVAKAVLGTSRIEF